MRYSDNDEHNRDFMLILILSAVLFFVASMLLSCSSFRKSTTEATKDPVEVVAQPYDEPEVKPTKPIQQTGGASLDKIDASIPVPPKYKYPNLYWENTIQPHPERIPWTKILIDEVNSKFDRLDKATDMVRFCPKYKTLNKDQKLNVWGELLVWLAYYESGFDPANASVDVGSEDDKDSWSVGLFQMSVIDRESYNLQKELPYYSFNQLKTVEPNIKLALAILAQQIDKTKLIIQNSRKYLYWATMYDGGSYDESARIIYHVKKLNFCN